ncbi:arylsulfatase A-like enzyme [Lewinella marina]|uniref:Arylsulfatase n=1 Tax=Neolewinella marina TaxID=438751 RepID=A0A2G0CAZ8_9BACT|nr:sulfatase [Neolewinella marina]NJB84286.1 arylsulfatase A-like enzyme [Neolewinella marina]PHK97159.1 arylsulfatase [Neolewinella marina]
MRTFAPIFFLILLSLTAQAQERPPNIVVVFTDDLGYGDLSSFGHPTIRTPHIDGIGRRGAKLTSFYVGANVCSPSRAALLTGRLPVRSGMVGEKLGVLFPFSTGGMPQTEVTLAEALRDAGYATGMVGKWHLGHLPDYLPTRHGFDYYYGIPYSNDMRSNSDSEGPLKQLYSTLYMLEGENVVIEDVDQHQLTIDYTEKVLDYIDDHRQEPFFMYYAPNFPHVPLYASEAFEGSTRRGLYGDVVEELDWSVGQILDRLRQHGLEENTIVVFTSDNGPWTTQDEEGGSAGLLRGGKGSCWEGGMRVPAVVQWPGTIPGDQIIQSLGTTMDLYTTLIKAGGGRVPTDRPVDGNDLMPVWKGEQEEATETLFYYHLDQLYAVRSGPWKMHLKSIESYSNVTLYTRPQLYHLDHDPSEQYEVSARHGDVVRRLRELVRQHEEEMEEVRPIFDDINDPARAVLSQLGF